MQPTMTDKQIAATMTELARTPSPTRAPSPSSTHTAPPPYPGPASSFDDEKTRRNNAEIETQIETACIVPDTTALDPTCAAKGHDTRPSAKRMAFIVAAWPCSLIYLHTQKTVPCRRCKERVERKGCCLFS